MSNINQVSSVLNVLRGASSTGETVAQSESATAFSDVLSQAMALAETTTTDSATYNDALLIGELDNLHDATISSAKAELAINLTVQIRNKVVEAYNEIMRMSV